MGRHLGSRLLREGHHVRCFSRSEGVHSDGIINGACTHQLIDFRDQVDFRPLIDGCDTVIQLISTRIPSSSNADPIADVTENLIPMLRLFKAMPECGIKKFIFPSSGGTVYGNPRYQPIDEEHPTNPIVSYGATKLAIEKFAHAHLGSQDIKTTILRISNPYGPGFSIGSPQGAIGSFLHQAINNSPITIWGDGNVVRDYIYIDDVMESFLAALRYNGPETIFNISTGRGHSLLDIVKEIEIAIERPVVLNFREGRAFDVSSNILSNNRACTQLNWHPDTSLQTGLVHTATWLKGQIISSDKSL